MQQKSRGLIIQITLRARSSVAVLLIQLAINKSPPSPIVRFPRAEINSNRDPLRNAKSHRDVSHFVENAFVSLRTPFRVCAFVHQRRFIFGRYMRTRRSSERDFSMEID